MASQNKLDVVVSFISKGLADVNRGLDGMSGKLKNMAPAFTKMAAIGTVAFAGISSAVGYSLKVLGDAERAQRQLEYAIIDVSKGTQEQVEQIEDLSDALERKSGIDADGVKIGAAQLSTFGLQSASVVGLTKSLADLTVNQNGVKASAEQYTASANMIQKALQGQFGMLEKSGIRFTESQQAIIKYGTEAEKVVAIQEGFAQNLKETTDTLGGVDAASAKLSNSLGHVVEQVGRGFAGALGAVSEKLTPFLYELGDFIAANPELVQGITIVVGGLALLAATLGTLGLIMPTIIAGFQLVTGAITPWSIALMAVVAAGVYLYTNWAEIQIKAVEIWTAITEFLMGVWVQVTDIFTGIATNVTETMKGVWDAITAIWDGIIAVFTFAIAAIAGALIAGLEAMGVDVEGLLSSISDFFSNFWAGVTELYDLSILYISTAITNFLTNISVAFTVGWTAIKNFLISIWKGLKATVSGGINWILGLVGASVDPMKSAFANMWDGVTGVFSSAFEGLKDMVKNVLNWMLAQINKVIGGLNSLASSAAGIIGLEAPQIPTIPMLAQGGIVTRPTLAMIGEGGEPEAVIPLSKIRNFGGGGGGGVNVYVTGNTFLNKGDFESMIDNVLMKKLRKNLITS